MGPFVGYNYYTQAIDTFGCTQVAGSTPCSTAFPAALLGLTERDSFNSLRVGLSSEVMLTERLRLTADAAYVPWVSFSGTDDHLLRQLLLLEKRAWQRGDVRSELGLLPHSGLERRRRHATGPGTPAPAA